ncbi:carboxylesterase/lipase family protein [Paludibacter jiangxiensis]|uniref:Carboxylic ester hydrolase n=1 Tax=Paludibacter jiangxiensis TaxID=681398 RepID=A0A170YEG0_9BACT|nr:carboxylesterase family protein [Paludibacter jiangxiensis]GAT61742.1 para-nitrobenzyl esterase [Paludibacter jiangxiensis]
MKRSLLLTTILLAGLSPVFSQTGNNETAIVSGNSKAVVQTDCGKVRGFIHKGTFIFKGIPYAEAERFMPPVRVKNWDGIRSSMTYGPVCPLEPMNSVNDESEFIFHHDWGYQNEDCLRLNIWAQGINDTNKRPVMVWLHGGGYSAGSSQELPSYDGENLSKKGDIVLVSINHRLNVLGFLDLSAYGEKYHQSANVGMMDIVAALQWIKNNIAQFGGDPDNVTIFGQSGGGGKVITLMNAPSAKGLFHKAISQSGVVSNFREPAITKQISAEVLTELKLNPSQVDSLQKIPYNILIAASKKAIAKVQQKLASEGKISGDVNIGWSPVLDGFFLHYQPSDAKATAISKEIPLLIGSTKNEFIPSLSNPKLRHGTIADITSYINNIYKDKAEAYIDAVKQAYPGDNRPSDLIDIDLRFRAGVLSEAKLKSTTGSAPVYMYLFGWQSPVMDGDYKAMHCFELPFVFNNIGRCEEMTGGGKAAYELADKISQAWINFARTGNPNHKGLPEWPVYSVENGALMYFDNKCVVKNHHDDCLMNLTTKK